MISLSKSTESKDKINDLFYSTNRYRYSEEFKELLNFCKKFHYLSPYNAMLVQIQRPGAKFVNTASWWHKKYQVRIKPNANPMLILVPFGPVDFVFDISDLEGENIGTIPETVLNPFKNKGKISAHVYDNLINNLKFFGIKFEKSHYGNQLAARIKRLTHPTFNECNISIKKSIFKISLPEYYLISINKSCNEEEAFASIIHELGHFFCEHLAPPRGKWWETRHINLNIREFEAETVTWLICERCGINSPSEKYLSGYLENNQTVPNINLESVLKAVNKIETLFNPIRIFDGILAKNDDEVKKQLMKTEHEKQKPLVQLELFK